MGDRILIGIYNIKEVTTYKPLDNGNDKIEISTGSTGSCQRYRYSHPHQLNNFKKLKNYNHFKIEILTYLYV
ncbi:hypothetical protein RhiirC2_803485 [Rhizophagus irregularis]|uniref:Uncharacterized protein n=1 Tax=Rhizophagus irregularis TaxID=588596 RepID=A0A2N1LIC7_9GLOM|nr:hypothetical protein RhiirC2_803485 [Rhizophagus irregularis]